MKHLEDTPEFICNKEKNNYCVYIDTDSNYFHAEPILKKLYPNFDEMSNEEKDDLVEKLATASQDMVGPILKQITEQSFNQYNPENQRIDFKNECVLRSGYIRATRRYTQYITREEGIPTNKFDIKGLEFKKANFPPKFGKFFEWLVLSALEGVDKEILDSKVKQFRTEILDGTIPLSDLANPTSVKKLNKYTERKARSGEIFSKIGKGAPAAVKATIIYNDLLRFWNLHKTHSEIAQGDKIKWIYLKHNPYNIEAIALLEWDYPDKMRTFIEEYADRKKIFESVLLNKLEGFYSDMEWQLNLNPYKEMFFNL